MSKEEYLELIKNGIESLEISVDKSCLIEKEEVVDWSYINEMKEKSHKLYNKILIYPILEDYEEDIISMGKAIIESLRMVQSRLVEINFLRTVGRIISPDIKNMERRLKLKGKKLMMMGKILEISLHVSTFKE